MSAGRSAALRDKWYDSAIPDGRFAWAKATVDACVHVGVGRSDGAEIVVTLSNADTIQLAMDMLDAAGATYSVANFGAIRPAAPPSTTEAVWVDAETHDELVGRLTWRDEEGGYHEYSAAAASFLTRCRVAPKDPVQYAASFNTQWGCIVANEHTTVEQIMALGVPRKSAESLLAIACAGAQRLRDKERPDATTEVR